MSHASISPALRAARLHTICWPLTLMWPWAIMASSWLINYLIFAALDNHGVDAGYTGGLASLYVVQFVVFVQLFTRGFQFAVNLSVTRRAYYTGTWLVVLVLCVADAVVLTALKAVEDATGGWGVHLRFFGVPVMVTDDVLSQVLVYAGPLVLGGGLAATYGVVAKRWGSNGVLTAVLLTVVVPGLMLALISWQDVWSEVGEWFADQTTSALFAFWPGLVAAVCAVGGFLVARRTSF